MVYQNLTKTRTFKVEAKGKGFSIIEYRRGGRPKVMAEFYTGFVVGVPLGALIGMSMMVILVMISEVPHD